MTLTARTKELHLADEMGFQMVTVIIKSVNGENMQVMSVHRNLLCNAGGNFEQLIKSYPDSPTPGEICNLGDTVPPEVFKHFIAYLYTKKIPSYDFYSGDDDAKVQALTEMIHLYSFAEYYDVVGDFRNKIVDMVQDGLSQIDSIVKAGIVDTIYQETMLGSQLRKLVALCLLHYLRSPDFVQDYSLNQFLGTNNDALDDFVEAAKTFEIGKNPFIRDCAGHQKCVECHQNSDHMAGKPAGISPCQFHVHKVIGPFKEMRLKRVNGVQVLDDDGKAPQREQCHLFAP